MQTVGAAFCDQRHLAPEDRLPAPCPATVTRNSCTESKRIGSTELKLQAC